MTPEELAQSFSEDWEIACSVPIRWNGTTPEQLQSQGRGIVRTYVESISEPVVPEAVEKEITVPVVNLETGEKLRGVEINGFLDRLNPGNVPVELKTSSSSWNQWKADSSLQMTVYCYMTAFHQKQERVEGNFEVLVKNKTPKLQQFTTTRNVRHFRRMYATIEQITAAINNGIFYPSTSFFCSSCDYKKECHAW